MSFPKLLAALLSLVSLVPGQIRRVDPSNTLERIICVVPMVGAGTAADPKRPQYAPWPSTPTPSATGIIAFSHQVSDDGRFAIVEFVARDRKAFQAILGDASVKKFEKGKDKKEDIERELKKFRKDFDLNKNAGVRP